MRLIDLLKLRKDLAESFTKSEFIDRVKQEIKNYEANPPTVLDNLSIDLIESFNQRYRFTIPLIFTNHESMMASIFDRMPDLVFFSGGEDDDIKKQKVEATYEYLKRKLDLESFANEAAWWFILSGFASSHADYVKKTREVPIYDDEGEVEIDEDGKQKTMNDYDYDDPVISVDDPFKTFFSPESEFSYSADKVPFYVRHRLLEVDEIKRIYKKTVDADTTIKERDGVKVEETVKGDLDRVNTYFYYGRLPKKVSGEIKGWSFDKEYYIVFTAKEILYKEELDMRKCRLLKWHGSPNKFFGFGVAKLLQPFQKEKSIRRGQQVRFADVAAFPKILLPNGGTWDKNALRDPREQIVLTYDKDEGKPEYLGAPNIGQAVLDANTTVDQDAQQASGMLDLASGSQQSSTVNTATGQTIFADAAEKRMRQAKKKFLSFYRENVILLLKLCQQNWDSEKLVRITDNDGQYTQVSINKNDLSDIDFDTDVDIETESVTINRDILREQAIALYDKVKDDPLIDRKEVFKDMVSRGFNEKNPERLMKKSPAQPGTQLIDPNSGQSFFVGESGELIDEQTMSEMRQPSGQQQIPSSPSGLMGATQNVGV